jgi:hypothetical protein
MKRVLLTVAVITVAIAVAAYAQRRPRVLESGKYWTNDYGSIVVDDYHAPVPLQ